jgi:predicted nucleic acid-binding Zn ribbon protein
MPVYAYFCAANGETLEVVHSMKEDLGTWGDVCDRAGREAGATPRTAAVERIIYPVGVSVPMSNSKLKELGFTKLVRREKGVYENVTRAEGDKKYMTADDPSSVPDFSKRIGD